LEKNYDENQPFEQILIELIKFIAANDLMLAAVIIAVTGRLYSLYFLIPKHYKKGIHFYGCLCLFQTILQMSDCMYENSVI
jgi:hypothetical protein